MNRKKANKSLYIVMICLLAAICAIPAVSAFFTDHAVLSAQIKTGTWNYSLAIDPKGGTWNGKTGATLMENLEAGETVSLADPKRTGYTFVSWTASANNAGKLDSARKLYTIAPDSKDTLSASWKANQYKVAFNGNGADGGTMAAQTLTYDAKAALSANAFTRTGYSFNGWNTSADGKGTAYADKAQVVNLSAKSGDTVNLYAQWKTVTYSISYDLNGGTAGSGSPTSYTIESSAITLPAPTRTGYTFAGWTGANGTTPQKTVTIATGSSGNRTYTANWTPNTYTVTYNGNGASSGSMASQTATYASDFITAKNAFTRTGYTFNGWNEKADGSGTPWALTSSGVAESGKKWKWTYTNNITLFAQWAANKYTVSFNANGGTGAVSSVTATYDSNLPGITNSMSRTGYTFAGFYDAATGGTQYYNASNVAVKTWNKAANATLYAHWTLTPYKFDVNPQSHVTGFKLKKNGADVSGGSTLTDYYQDAYMGDVFTVHSPTFAAGYTFDGYTKQEGSGAQTVSGTTATVTMGAGPQSIAITAKPVTYSIGYNLNGGTVSGQKTSYTIESDAFTLPTPSKSGWTFTGWSGTGLSGNANKTVTVAKGSTGNRSYTAHFSKTITLTQKHGTSTTTQTYALTDSVTSHAFTLATTKDSYDGWTFIGWRDSATPGPKQYDPTGTITLSADHTVYATYSQTQTLTFVDYNGTTKQTRTVTGTAYGNNSAGGVANQYPTLTAPNESAYTGWESRGWSTSTASNAAPAVASGGTIANATAATYYGLYQQNVKLTYNANGGSSTPAAQTGVRYANSSSISAYTNPSFTLAAGITRTGYTFAGWSVSAPISAVKAANTAITPASGTALTATAQWTANNYTVTYEDWFVDKNNARKLKLGSTTKAKPYDSTVNGSELGADGSTSKYYGSYAYKSSTSAKVTTSGATVYRYFWAWTDLNIFYADGSTQHGGTVGLSMDGNNYTDVDNEGASNTVQPYGTTYYIKNIRPKHSYETLDRVENLTLSNGVYTYTPVKAGTSMGIWMKYITYSISYNLNSGAVSGNPTSYNYGTAAFTLKNPTRTGYTFSGWTGSNGTTPQTTVTVAKGTYGNKSYTANWTANTNTKYTVIHQQEQLDGTYKTVETQNLTGTTDAKVTPAVKSYTGFTAPSTQTITIAANGSASVTYKYTRNSYTITRQYRSENANGTFTGYTQIDSKSYKYGATVAAWSRAADTTYKATSIAAHTVGAKNETLSVNVMRNTSTNNVIQYRLQNADGSYPSAYTTGWSGTLRYGESHTWSLAQTVSHAAASKSVSYNGGTLKVDVPRRTGRLVINANGGSFSGSTSRTTSVIRYGSTGDNISPMPTRTGYTLNGLYTAASGGTKVVNADGNKANDGTYSKNGAWQLNSDVPVYAQWTANKYTVTLSKGQGIDSVSGAGTYTYGQTVTIDATVNTNYNWSQWNVLSGTVSGTLTNKKLTFTMPAGNVSLRAGDASGNDAHRKTYVITYHANLHDGQKLQAADGTGSTDTHISSVPSGAVKGTSGGIEVYQQTILSGGGSKTLANGFSWTAVKAAAAKVMSTLFDTNWDE